MPEYSTSVQSPCYRLESKSFNKKYKLGKLTYLPNVESLLEDETHLLDLLQEQNIYPAGNQPGLFLLEDTFENKILLPSHILQVLECCRKEIINETSKFNYPTDIPEDEILYQFIHPVAPGKCFVLKCIYVEIGLHWENLFTLTFDGLNTIEDVPIVTFHFDNFQKFLNEFLPRIGYYSNELAIQNFALPKEYKYEKKSLCDHLSIDDINEFNMDNKMVMYL